MSLTNLNNWTNALYTLLSADTTLKTTYSCEFYEGMAKPGAVTPHIVIGLPWGDNSGTFGSAGSENYLDIHVWNTYPAGKRTKDIAQRILTIIGDMEITISEGVTAFTYFVDHKSLLDNTDGSVNYEHVILTFKTYL